MRHFNLSNKREVGRYWEFKYGYLLNAYLTLFHAQREELAQIQRHAGFGETLLLEGDHQGALESLLTALEVAPNNAQSHNNLGVFYWMVGERQKSIDHFARARRLNPNHRDTVWNCGQIMADSREYLLARSIYQHYMRENGWDREMSFEINSLCNG